GLHPLRVLQHDVPHCLHHLPAHGHHLGLLLGIATHHHAAHHAGPHHAAAHHSRAHTTVHHAALGHHLTAHLHMLRHVSVHARCRHSGVGGRRGRLLAGIVLMLRLLTEYDRHAEHQCDCRHDDEHLDPFHCPLPFQVHSSTRRSRRALPITDTELNVIAALAMIGLSRMPATGYSTPAAMG